ncbi:MAG: DUF3089 domain-containing protein [Clostridia bacterium]|nr:DUF3089 domain-containing protein [Clostridia bacterium]
MQKGERNMKRKILSIVLTICMVAALLPQVSITAKADGKDVFDYSNAPSSDEVFYLRVEIASNGTAFQIPVCGKTAYSGSSFTYGVSYNWIVDWGDGNSTEETGSSSSNGYIEHTYGKSGTYTIIIRPNGTVSDGWFRAFGFDQNNSGPNTAGNRGKLTGFAGILDDTSINISGIVSCACCSIFANCTNLTAANILFNTEATTAGNYFATNMFFGCTSLTALPGGFNLPSGISSSVGNYIAFEVTPSDGTDTGGAVISSWVGPVTAASSETPIYSDDTLIYNPVTFPDTDGHWAEAAINDMASREIISGYPDGFYVPEGSITRAEFAAVIVRALGLPSGVCENKFSDVSGSDWCCGFVETAVAYGLMTGYPDGSFGLSDRITREQAMTVVARAMDITKLDAGLSDDEIASLLADYPDAAVVSAYAASGAAACIKTGVITGKDGALAPQEAITRAEAAVVVQRLLVKSGLINPPESDSENTASDYSAADNWLTLPDTNEYDVDVFYLYPTAYYRFSPDDPVVCEIDNALMRTNAVSAHKRQATAFQTVGNIYAPYYRQPDAVTTLSLSEKEKDELLKGATKKDVFAAFDYYIEHYNNGRPFILAGHSLGSNMLLYLLSEYMEEHPDVYARMVAAYVIGYSVTEDYLGENPNLKFAESADDTGVIISYNTQAAAVEGKNPVVLDGALVINPITWTRDGTTAGAEKNLGSIMLNTDGSVVLDENGEFKRVMNFADATVDSEKGALICSTVDVDTWGRGNAVFPNGVFHSFDYPFYYYNIRENAANRAKRFCET